jgi:hypothetical protein
VHRCGMESGNSVDHSGLPMTSIAMDGRNNAVDH